MAEVKGLGFPLQFGPLGHLEKETGITKIKSNLKNIVLTSVEERFMEPSFGTIEMGLLFRNIDTTTFTLIRNIVATAIATHEPRVAVGEITFEAIPEDGQVNVTINFALRSSGEFDDLTVLLGEQ